MNQNTIDTIMHDSGNFRVRVVTDPEPYDVGDLFTREGVKGSDLEGKTDDELKYLEAEYLEGIYRLGGPWGWIVERKCPSCGAWEQIESCWGIDDDGYAGEEGIASMRYFAEKEGGS